MQLLANGTDKVQSITKLQYICVCLCFSPWNWIACLWAIFCFLLEYKITRFQFLLPSQLSILSALSVCLNSCGIYKMKCFKYFHWDIQEGLCKPGSASQLLEVWIVSCYKHIFTFSVWNMSRQKNGSLILWCLLNVDVWILVFFFEIQIIYFMKRCGPSSFLSACDVIKEVLFYSITQLILPRFFFSKTIEITHLSSEALKKDRNESVKLFAGNLVT